MGKFVHYFLAILLIFLLNEQISSFYLKETVQAGPDYFRCIQNGTIAITFDDGPAVGPTDQLVDVLAELNVSTTFFVIGGWGGSGSIESSASRATVLRAVANGHQIGHHSWSHEWPGLIDIPESAILSEMNLLTQALQRILGQPPTIMRPPFGEYNNETIRIVNGQLGFKMILWSIDTNDWQHPGDTEAGLEEYRNVLNGTVPSLTPGFIALHHDPLEGSSELARATITYARSLGYRFVSLTECLGL